MKCPACGKEMESGELCAMGMWTYFLPENAEALKILSVGGIEKRDGIVLHDPYGFPGNEGRPVWQAAVCRNCRTITMEY